MSEKYLSEKEWKAFAKGADYKDTALVKALASLEKAGRAPGEQAKALDELGRQVDALRKQHKSDRKLAAQLGKMDDELDSRRKEAEAAAAAEEEAQEEESPALLTTKLIPLLREVRKGELVLQSLVAVAGRETVVLLSRRAISPARGKLLKEQMTNPGGLKFIRGECRFEQGAMTFVVQNPAAGLAKKIRAALIQQTDLRFKVRVRGEDPDDIDEDGEADEADAGAGAAAAAKAPPAPEQRAYETRWAALEPRYAKALRESAPEASKLRALQALAEAKAAGGNHAAALQAVESMEKLLGQGIPPAPPLPPAGPKKTEDPVQAFTARLTALVPRIKDAAASARGQDIKLKASEAGVFARKKEFDRANALLDEAEAMLAQLESSQASSAPAADIAAQREVAKACLQIWRDAKDEADAGLSKLQDALRRSGEPALERIAEMGLNGVSRGLQVGLRVAMEEFARQSDPAGGAAQKLRRSVSDFRRFLDTDPAVQLCDDNPFGVKVDLRAVLGKALGELDQRLDDIVQ